MHRLISAVVIVALSLLVACQPASRDTSTSSYPSAPSATPAAPKFTPYPVDQAKIVTFKPGLRAYIHKQGSGKKPVSGDNVIVNYHGVFEDGREFDSSFLRGQPYTFQIGRQAVIRGWDEGFLELPVGTQAVLFLAPEYAYGESGNGSIPPNTPLIFHVEVLGIAPQ